MKNKLIIIILLIVFLLNIPKLSTALTLSSLDSNEYIILIDLYDKTLTLLNKRTQQEVKTYPIAIGKKSTPSPIGTWQIKSKSLMKGPFGGYWLGLNAPWDTFGIHGTSNPSSIGSMASNGCIRLYNHNIKELFNLVDYDTSVIISGGPNWRFSPYDRDITPNCKGADVYHIQRILNALGYFNHPADGIYGYSLELAVKQYKTDHDLYPIDSYIDNDFLKSIGCERFE